eukprot:GEZU01007877.1.p2 GENE.GEZU01007877.1~~GEZU01007877.1.p2  ORF type:complete len:743 (-),score=242.94 GEZU01007877.1:2331-4559(-)
MTEILALFQKRTDYLDLSAHLRRYVAKTYGEHEAKEYDSVFGSIQRLRDEVRNLQDRNETSRDVLLKYYSHLNNIETHFPINDGGKIKLSFTWYDCFTKRKATQSNISYEQACVLFNAAAISSQVGASETRATAESAKTAAKHFQAAAGIFDYIKEQVAPRIVESRTTDLLRESLEVLSLMMLAYGQQCTYEMAVKTGKTSNPTLAKLAAEAAAMFKQVLSQMNNSALAGQFDKTWTTFMRFQALYFDTRAQFHLSIDLHAKDKIGEELSRLHKCAEWIKEAASCAKSLTTSLQAAVKEFSEQIDKHLKGATRDNDKVYHERVPRFDALSPIEGHRMAKPTPIDALLTAAQVPDAFSNLIPVRVLEAKNLYTTQLNQRVQAASRAAREHRERIKAALAQMNLPGAILAAEKKEGLPQEVFVKIEKVQQQGGITRLQELLQLINQMSGETRTLCEKVEKAIQEEEDDDRQCREQFAARWPRHPSPQLTVNLKKQLADFKHKVQIAQQSDQLIQNKINDNRAILEKLELSKPQLDALMPHFDFSANSGLGQSHQELKQFLQEMDNMHLQEENIEKAIAQMQEQDDVQSVLLKAQDNLEATVEATLRKYDAPINELTAIQQREDDLIARIQTANASFTASKAQNSNLEQRESVIQSFVAGVNKYEEIMANLKEGTQFYSNMQELIKKLKQRVEDFVFARKTEKQDIISNLQGELTGVQFQYGQQPQYLPYGQQPLPQQQQLLLLW